MALAGHSVTAGRRRGVSPIRLRLVRLFLALLIGGAGLMLVFDGVYIKAKAVVAQSLLQSAWTRTLAGEAQARPWPWADVWPVALIEAPRLGKSAIALSGTSGEALAFGPGLMQGTAKPGGQGLSIIAAHRDTHFRFLKDIALGDEIAVTGMNGVVHTYRINQTFIVDASASGLVPDEGAPRIALVTCYPFDAAQRGPLRFVAVGVLVRE